MILAALASESDLDRVRVCDADVTDPLGDEGAGERESVERARCSSEGWPVRA